jgi:hypothetical protein
MKKFFAVILIMITTVIVTSAQRPGDRLQRHSIRNAVRSGQITSAELLDLRKDQLRYLALQRRAQRDGVMTPYERRKLHKMKKQNRRQAFRYKHNRQRCVI